MVGGPPVRRRVHPAGAGGGRLAELLDPRGRLDDVVGERVQHAVARGTQREVLDRRRPVPDGLEHLAPRERALHRPTRHRARREHGEDRPGVQEALRAEPAADVRRRDLDVVLVQREEARDRATARRSRPGRTRGPRRGRRPPSRRSSRAAPSGCGAAPGWCRWRGASPRRRRARRRGRRARSRAAGSSRAGAAGGDRGSARRTRCVCSVLRRRSRRRGPRPPGRSPASRRAPPRRTGRGGGSRGPAARRARGRRRRRAAARRRR